MQHGIFPDLVVGTSVGDLNGVWLAKDPTMDGVEKLKEMGLSLEPCGPFHEGNLRVLARLLLGRNYLYANKTPLSSPPTCKQASQLSSTRGFWSRRYWPPPPFRVCFLL